MACWRSIVTSVLMTLCVVLGSAVAEAVPFSQEGDASSGPDPFELVDRDFLAWRAHVLPDEVDLEWERIAWLPSFSEGLREAARVKKPLLLWLMNGHPLGCT